MKKLQSYLKLLSIGSVIVLAGTTISCSNINNSATRNFVIPTVNRRPNNNSSSESNSNEDSRNNTTPENNQPVNNDQGTNHNNPGYNAHPNNNNILNPIDNNTSDIFNNNQTYFSSISSLTQPLTQFENKYINFENRSFQPLETNENKAKDIILNSKLPTNFYSHPQYRLDQNHIILDEFINNEVKLKLIDSETKREVSNSDIKWYQKISYPEDKILEPNETRDKGTFILSDQGVVKWKDTKASNEENGPEEKSARLWASYKGYLYSVVVTVYSKEKSQSINNENEAKKMAKKIVEDNGWKKLPTLEKLTRAYEWMTKNVKYDYDFTTGPLLKNQNAHSALVNRHTVCTGYAKGLKLLLEELGIPCRFIEGSSDREARFSKHAWNLVQLDNKWYHLDTTSDRVERKDQVDTEFKFFLNTNKDFMDDDTFDRNFSNPGSSLRNLKFKNFVDSEEDVVALIDNNWDPNTKQLKKLDLVTNGKNFITVTNAFDKRGLVVKDNGYRINTTIGPNKEVTYTFNEQKNEITEVGITNVQKETNENAIRIDFDRNISDLKAGNFNIKNALIKKVENRGTSYILYLHHFSTYGKVKVELDSIKRKDFKFNLNNKKTIEFDIQQQEKPNVSIQTLDNKTIKITSQLTNLEYNFNNNSWQDVPKDFILKDGIIGNLYIRFKETNTKPSSDIQTIKINKASDVDKTVKIVDNNMLIGVDKTMEYKKEEDKDWTPIKQTALKDLKKGNYLIRAKANETTLASDISKVEIR
ncbi:MAG6410 family transglutaminase-related lipoprotein [Mycoplasma feriruminatoris]|uniref:Transglutaminase-like domain-containing protein n=1 Tax=Mycoplasma feriruminatoris TaxID=1179777 RepID=A0AAX3TFK6_9MOLU|nr:transglutaminase domain-containing protein [Mycoplasma feriruminatoris]WFQ92703.1 hypothetical protein MFERI14822_00492 [Mycoplasma feriruminatoris]